MNIDDAFPSPYISAADLPSDGIAVTFQSVSMEYFEDDKRAKAILYFTEFPKGMLLNKTNKNSIVGVLGSKETNTWIGQRITIYPTECDFKGERVACIRVRLRAPEKDANVGAGIRAMLHSFADLGVTRVMLEGRLGHPITEITQPERDKLREIHDQMITGNSKWPVPVPDLTSWIETPKGGELVVNRGW